MITVWCRVAYTDACLEVEVEICIMSFCDDVFKGVYPLDLVDERWLAEEPEACYALDVPEDLRVQQHWCYYAICYYQVYFIRSFAYVDPC
jgi:hypothetical protein